MSKNTIIKTNDGSHSIFSGKFGVTYHSKFGAIQESAHIFIENGLSVRSLIQKNISILEIGFGTGLNAFLSYLETEKRDINISYLGIDAYPLPYQVATRLNYTKALNVVAKQSVFLQIHREKWNTPFPVSNHFLLEKRFAGFEKVEYPTQSFDLIFFDAFDPAVQPHLWETPFFKKMYDALLPEGFLITYSAKGSVKRNLKAAGFEVIGLPGPPGKREITKAIK